MSRRVIFHVDVNSAFLSWEAEYRMSHLGGSMDLRQEISAVGGDMSKRHGIILAKSIRAGQYGVRTGEPIPQACRKCPGLILVPPNYGLYQRCSAAFMEILWEYSPVVQQYSIDEAFVDMTGAVASFGGPKAAAESLKNAIRDRLGFTVNVGVSSNRLLAKMASDFEKPDRVHTLFTEEIREKMWPLPVRNLFFVGAATEQKLALIGVHTIGQLAETDPEILRCHLGKHGEVIWNFANGRDVSSVEAEAAPNKGYGNSTTTPCDVTDPSAAKLVLLGLSETVAHRLRADGASAGSIGISLRDRAFRDAAHQRVLAAPTNITDEIWRTACGLFDELWDGKPLRHIGIQTGRICYEAVERQYTLFDMVDFEKMERLDQAVDAIRKRFGNDAVFRASFLKSPIDHMAGGISREKRSVDYEKQEIL